MGMRDFTNGELGIMLQEIKEDIREIKTLFPRVNSLENWRWYIAGIVSFFLLVIFPVSVVIIRYM